jgi:hypothetical protein
MAELSQSIDRELIRHRIKKRMAGRRDLLLHCLVYVAIAIIVRANVTWHTLEDALIPGVLWTVPLILHGLRYYYRCGPGAVARADEIEGAIEFSAGVASLDADEELAVEERAGKRIAARRLVAAHFVTASILVALLFTLVWLNPDEFSNNVSRLNGSSLLGLVFALHFVRFFLVHGRTPAGRALKIEAEIERRWHQSSGRRGYEEIKAGALHDLGELRGRRVRLTADGELQEGDPLNAGLERPMRARKSQ